MRRLSKAATNDGDVRRSCVLFGDATIETESGRRIGLNGAGLGSERCWDEEEIVTLLVKNSWRRPCLTS